MIEIIGALAPTFLVSRLWLWLLRSWDGGLQRYLIAHSGSLLVAILLAGMGMADGGAFAPAMAAVIYAPAQAFWLIVDGLRYKRQNKKEPKSKTLAQ